MNSVNECRRSDRPITSVRWSWTHGSLASSQHNSTTKSTRSPKSPRSHPETSEKQYQHSLSTGSLFTVCLAGDRAFCWLVNYRACTAASTQTNDDDNYFHSLFQSVRNKLCSSPLHALNHRTQLKCSSEHHRSAVRDSAPAPTCTTFNSPTSASVMYLALLLSSSWICPKKSA